MVPVGEPGDPRWAVFDRVGLCKGSVDIGGEDNRSEEPRGEPNGGPSTTTGDGSSVE